MDDGLTSLQVCEATGLTYRRLDHWVRAGYVRPLVEASGSGSQRLFAREAVGEILDMLERLRACPFDHHRV